MTALVELSIHRKSFADGTTLFKGLSLTVAPGERIALMGPSGVGKTTLLNILAGVDTDFEGELRRPAGPLRVGVMFQAPRLLPWLTVGENVGLVMRARGSSPQRIQALLQAVELAGSHHAFPKRLSGGMQRRVALARAIADEPDLLLLDEPFVSLDDALSVRLYERILGALAPSVAVVMATHNLAEAMTLADRVIFLSGRPARISAEACISDPRPRTKDAIADLERRLRHHVAG